MKKFIVIIGIVSVIAAVSLLTFYRNSTTTTVSPNTSALNTVKVGYQPFTGNWVMFLAVEKGMFKDEGINIEPISFSSGTDALNALAKGDIAVHAINTYVDLMNLEARTPGAFRLFIVQETSDQYPTEALLIRKDSPIKTVGELTGKKIGVIPGVFSETMVKNAFKNVIDFSGNTQIVKIPPANQLAVLENGQIDALLASDPTITIGLSKGTVAILEDHPWKRVQEPFPVGGFTISTQYIKDNPEIAKKIVKVLLRSLDHGTKNRPEVIKTTAKFTKLDEDLVAHVRQVHNLKVSELPADYFDNVAKLFYNVGLVNVNVSTSNFRYAD